MKKGTNNSTFGRIGIVLAAAGSAVGLGNIWKFPYMIGENGGAAFLVVYLACVILFGIPLMTTEFYIGRKGLQRWAWLRALTMISSTLFLSFYLVVTGWCFEYLYLSIANSTAGLNPDELAQTFEVFSTSHLMPILWLVLAIAMTAAIEIFGIKDGIERASKILMPVLFGVLLIMIGRGLMLSGSDAGMRFLFTPDFSKITPDLILNAMGQCFFSLSIGAGSLATYASYMQEGQNLPSTATRVIALDTLVAILAGMAIFPAVFALGIDPTEGPELVFVTLPSVFGQMAAGYWFQVLFFLLLSIAALTSTISLMEVQLNFLTQATKWSRNQSIVASSLLVLVLGGLAILSTTVFGWMDQMVSKYLLPIGGLIFAIYVGWVCPKKEILMYMTPQSGNKWIGRALYALVRYLIPVLIILIFLNGLEVF